MSSADPHVCMYACMHVCMYACMHVCICTHIYTPSIYLSTTAIIQKAESPDINMPSSLHTNTHTKCLPIRLSRRPKSRVSRHDHALINTHTYTHKHSTHQHSTTHIFTHPKYLHTPSTYLTYTHTPQVLTYLPQPSSKKRNLPT